MSGDFVEVDFRAIEVIRTEDGGYLTARNLVCAFRYPYITGCDDAANLHVTHTGGYMVARDRVVPLTRKQVYAIVGVFAPDKFDHIREALP